MALPANRWVCLSDLNNYFKRQDLLGGLTELEKLQLRKNVGILNYTGEGGQSQALEITYSALHDLYVGNSLIVGARYIITDYQTIYSSNIVNGSGKKVTWGIAGSENPSPIYRLVVIANTNNRLDSRVLILADEAKDWVVEYDISQEILEDGLKTKGKITYLKDSNGNSAFYDFKNIKFRRTAIELIASNLTINNNYIDLYTFSDIENSIAIDNSNHEITKYNVLEMDCWNNIFLGDTYNNIVENLCRNNTFIRGCHDTVLKWNSYNNLFNENVCYTSGSIYNKTIAIGNTAFSMSISKTIQKVNEVTLVSYLDPITYAYQIIIL